MKILITGASGFVGRHLTRKLLDLGHDVRVISRTGDWTTPLTSHRLEVLKGDVNDPASLKVACQDIHTVFHLAGVVGYSRAMRTTMDQTNIVGTKNVLEAFRSAGGQKFVHMSSVVAIGASFSKDHILNEESPYELKKYNLGYFETKKKAEELVLAEVAKGLDAVIVNPSTIYGPGDATKGSRSTQIKVARGVFPFYTSGGANVIHIDDLVAGVYSAWQKGRTGQRYILSGENLTIQQLFTTIASVAGVRPPSIYLPNGVVLALGQIGDLIEKFGKKGPLNSETARVALLYHWFDHSKAKRELGLNPRPAIDAIRESVQWMKDHKII